MSESAITVLGVEIIEEECDVFDIEVEAEACFIVCGVVVHNSAICRSLDGKVFRYDDPDRLVPPLHWNCRSTTIAQTDGPLAKKLGLGDSVDHSMQSYDQWLQTQSSSEQNSILGPSRASMWRAGTLTLANAIDQDGRTLTLAQLREAVSPVVPAGAQ